ncbi:arginine--tRNA ligase [Meiothermus granaticius]|uniref:Arginine--tRNA ligase n=1 Tax=Meiothermus granaticius NBRC 107808 TaxID=1227551 RepID=A0A399F4B4_9DEIN|nr:arginine--tRNA ligase [Meiothermus granaticius]RIH91038.1 Arginine--tRNA ligase [Meiothermus granaticius NBRC 107808]GEM85924.1 arginine--tRNA ligase [Meiothermus granaticius NBRC 107808]
MQEIKPLLKTTIAEALNRLGVAELPEIIVQETPPGKEGDYGTPVAMGLARVLRKAPPLIATEIAERLTLPAWVRRTFVTGGYLNFELEPAFLAQTASQPLEPLTPQPGKVLLEHTSVNPNKELHVGHLRNICLGDSLARILRFAGREVEVMNYIDDTGRQAAESLYALEHFGLGDSEGDQKYDHFAGEAYVRLHQEMQDPEKKTTIEHGVQETLHRLERGELRGAVERILRAQLETMYRLGAEYDALVWESDIVREGLLEKAMQALEGTPYVHRPTEGKYAGAFVMDMSPFIPGLEDPYLVLIRSNGTSTYTAKDIALQFWKMGLLGGVKFKPYDTQPSGHALYSSAPEGQPMGFGAATETINVVDARQSHALRIVQASLEVEGRPDLAQHCFHLAYETVLLEGQQMSGRKGITVSVDEVLDEAVRRARAIIAEKNPEHPSPETAAEAIGVGAVRFAMIKSEAKKQIDFRYEQALSFEGDTGPYVQYAFARACSILRKAEEQGLGGEAPDFSQATAYELELAKVLLRFRETVQEAARAKAPHLLAQYLLDLAAAWNTYYNAKTPEGKPATVVLGAPEGLRGLRLGLVRSLQRTLQLGLGLVGLQAPEVM